MSPAEYILLVDGVASGLCIAGGYGMIALGSTKARPIRICFWVGAIGFGCLGVIWAVWGADPTQPLWARIVIAGITGAIAAMALTWALHQIEPLPKIADSTLGLGMGGPGGNAKVSGNYSRGEGGAGGQGGIGPGGAGGSVDISGNHSFARGGDGGNAAQLDGRGGPRTISPGERLNLPSTMWSYGYGGRGANNPEYDRRLKILAQIRADFMKAFPDDVPFIEAGIDQVPISWVNKRLEELGESWRVQLRDGGYEMPPLNTH